MNELALFAGGGGGILEAVGFAGGSQSAGAAWGENDDWPISILCSEELYEPLCAAFEALRAAIEEVRPELVEWPLRYDE